MKVHNRLWGVLGVIGLGTWYREEVIKQPVGLLSQLARVGVVSSAPELLASLVKDGSGCTQALGEGLRGSAAASRCVCEQLLRACLGP